MNEYLETKLVHDRLKEMRDAAYRAAMVDQVREVRASKPVRMVVGRLLIRMGARLTRDPALA